MRSALLLIAVMVAALVPLQRGHAQSLACAPAIAGAERAEALPPGLLPAIGRVESGRFDPASGVVEPWPWTVDAGGVGRYFATRDEAIGAVRGLQAAGVRSIDVGCLQVNLEQHPAAFASLDQAFAPDANAAYAARFLRRLYAETGSWAAAAAAYHSRTPEFGLPYQRLVLSLWRGNGFVAAPWSGASADDRLVPAGPIPPLRPFAPPPLAGPTTPSAAAEDAAPLLAAAGACAPAGEAVPAKAWALPPARPCGLSPFSTTDRLLRLLAGHPPTR